MARDLFSGTTLAERCYESHPVLKLGKGKLYGGSASYPAFKEADVYVSLQNGSTSGRSSDPWDEQRVVEVHYSISDMQAPSNVPRFKKLVTWLCNQLQHGKTIHVGCIGGHGRSGVLISAIVAEMLEKKDAIQWVRKHYCRKAVESKAQVHFLMKHYDVTEVLPTKQDSKFSKSTKFDDPFDEWGSSSTQQALKTGGEPKYESKQSRLVRQVIPEGVTSKTKSFAPMGASGRSVWRKRKDLTN